MSQRIHYLVEGRVQGVNFRQSTVKEARKLNLTGFVQNDAGGSVSGEAQGSESHLKDFVTYLGKGPPAAKVDRVEKKTIETKDGETGFGVH